MAAGSVELELTQPILLVVSQAEVLRAVVRLIPMRNTPSLEIVGLVRLFWPDRRNSAQSRQ
ncbi:MAG TPA: hypothetical protein ACFYD2_11345 [Candidatus Avalokitesvara rifleensis]|uniref:hypothetical protein n=1 Tax=Candidatus Avalokitesvara rifleensis TaxID=3367620 RepID=UPI0040268EAD